MFGFLETDKRERQKYKKGIQTSVDNTVNVENCVKDKNNFFIKPNISFLFKTKIYFILGDTYFLRFLLSIY